MPHRKRFVALAARSRREFELIPDEEDDLRYSRKAYASDVTRIEARGPVTCRH
jgi:hypothetical protein